MQLWCGAGVRGEGGYGRALSREIFQGSDITLDLVWVVSENVIKGKPRAVDPPSPLLQELVESVHGICSGDSQGKVFQDEI